MPELVWDGKYRDGRKVAPFRAPLPFQNVETVNETAQARELMLDLWGRRETGAWRNRLIWGDKRYVLPSLLEEFAGTVDLIYIDPPFATGADFSYTAQVPAELDNNGGGGERASLPERTEYYRAEGVSRYVGPWTRRLPAMVLRDHRSATRVVGRERKLVCAS